MCAHRVRTYVCNVCVCACAVCDDECWTGGDSADACSRANKANNKSTHYHCDDDNESRASLRE